MMNIALNRTNFYSNDLPKQTQVKQKNMTYYYIQKEIKKVMEHVSKSLETQNQQIVDLSSKMNDMMEEIAQLREENKSLRESNQERTGRRGRPKRSEAPPAAMPSKFTTKNVETYARENGIDDSLITAPSGRNQKITKVDVKNFIVAEEKFKLECLKKACAHRDLRYFKQCDRPIGNNERGRTKWCEREANYLDPKSNLVFCNHHFDESYAPEALKDMKDKQFFNMLKKERRQRDAKMIKRLPVPRLIYGQNNEIENFTICDTNLNETWVCGLYGFTQEEIENALNMFENSPEKYKKNQEIYVKFLWNVELYILENPNVTSYLTIHHSINVANNVDYYVKNFIDLSKEEYEIQCGDRYLFELKREELERIFKATILTFDIWENEVENVNHIYMQRIKQFGHRSIDTQFKDVVKFRSTLEDIHVTCVEPLVMKRRERIKQNAPSAAEEYEAENEMAIFNAIDIPEDDCVAGEDYQVECYCEDDVRNVSDEYISHPHFQFHRFPKDVQFKFLPKYYRGLQLFELSKKDSEAGFSGIFESSNEWVDIELAEEIEEELEKELAKENSKEIEFWKKYYCEKYPAPESNEELLKRLACIDHSAYQYARNTGLFNPYHLENGYNEYQDRQRGFVNVDFALPEFVKDLDFMKDDISWEDLVIRLREHYISIHEELEDLEHKKEWFSNHGKFLAEFGDIDSYNDFDEEEDSEELIWWNLPEIADQLAVYKRDLIDCIVLQAVRKIFVDIFRRKNKTNALVSEDECMNKLRKLYHGLIQKNGKQIHVTRDFLEKWSPFDKDTYNYCKFAGMKVPSKEIVDYYQNERGYDGPLTEIPLIRQVTEFRAKNRTILSEIPKVGSSSGIMQELETYRKTIIDMFLEYNESEVKSRPFGSTKGEEYKDYLAYAREHQEVFKELTTFNNNDILALRKKEYTDDIALRIILDKSNVMKVAEKTLIKK